MYDEPGKTPHGLPHDPFKSCVVPRPIGWISTVDAQDRHNLAPYSQFQNVTFDPPIVMFSANQTTQGERRDSLRNAEQMGQFECEHLNTLRFPSTPPMGTVDMAFGRVVAIHIDDNAIDAQGRVDVLKLQPIARMGYLDYTVVDNQFQVVIPGNSQALLAGLEGSPEKAFKPSPQP